MLFRCQLFISKLSQMWRPVTRYIMRCILAWRHFGKHVKCFDRSRCTWLSRIILGIAVFVLFFAFRALYFSPWGPGYREPRLPPTRIPIAKAPASFAASLFHFSITPRLDFQNTRILLLVISAPSEHRRRRKLRRLWAHKRRLASIGAAAVFVVGATSDPSVFRKYQEENDAFGDILFDKKLIDNYNNLTRKVVGALYWVSIQPWKQLQFIGKVDSDSWIKIIGLKRITKLLDPDKPEIIGQLLIGLYPHRDKCNRWFMSKKQYALNYYPNYLLGQGYMMTMPAVQRISCLETLQDLQNNRQLIYEDVYITGILRQRLGIKLKHKAWVRLDQSWFQYFRSLIVGKD